MNKHKNIQGQTLGFPLVKTFCFFFGKRTVLKIHLHRMNENLFSHIFSSFSPNTDDENDIPEDGAFWRTVETPRKH